MLKIHKQKQTMLSQGHPRRRRLLSLTLRHPGENFNRGLPVNTNTRYGVRSISNRRREHRMNIGPMPTRVVVFRERVLVVTIK